MVYYNYTLTGLVVCVLFTVWGVVSGVAQDLDEAEDMPWFWMLACGATVLWPLTLFFLFIKANRSLIEWVQKRIKEDLEEHE